MENLLQAIQRRRSVRTFADIPLTGGQLSLLNETAADARAEFGGRYIIRIVSTDAFAGGHVPSTYGVIKGARCFMLLWCDDNAESKLSGGFAMEKLVLTATAMGLGTCWLGGTFSAKDFNIDPSLQADGRKLVAVVPVGAPAPREGWVGRMMVALAGSRGRKPFKDMFFSVLGGGIHLSEDCMWYGALEAMRQAPSSTNSQPWRAMVTDNGVEFFKARKGPLSDIDMGIGLSHFAIAMSRYGKRGRFIAAPPQHPVMLGWKYVTTFVV